MDMSPSRRSVLTAAGAALASFDLKGADAPDRPVADEIAGLIRRSADANAALMRGDIERYRALITLTDDFTLMSPFGGRPTRGAEMTAERWEAMGRFFRNGTLEQEVVHAYGSGDMVVLAVIERANVEVGGLPAQNWSLRVTLVYRKEAGSWRLAHRHADPIVESMSLAQAATIARGERV